VHEASLHEHNCFVTLTYDNEHLPKDGSLVYRHFQLFMKRLRRRVRQPVRFYMCGEYGETNSRPHYHACLFGFDFADKVPLRYIGASLLSRSALLSELWPYGFSSVGTVTFESASYTARYVLKKVNGDRSAGHYAALGPVDSDGVVSPLLSEFTHMSLKPGIGAGWLDKFASDVYPEGKVVSRGRLANSPRYYDRRHAAVAPDVIEELSFQRELEGRSRFADNTDARLAVRREVALGRIRSLRRSL